MTAPDPDNERFRAGLLASAIGDVPAADALDRELRRLGLATIAVAATIAVVSGSSAPAAVTIAAAGGAGPAAGVVAATKIGAGTSSILSGLSLTKIGVVAAIAVMSASGYAVLRGPPAAAPSPVGANANANAGANVAQIDAVAVATAPGTAAAIGAIVAPEREGLAPAATPMPPTPVPMPATAARSATPTTAPPPSPASAVTASAAAPLATTPATTEAPIVGAARAAAPRPTTPATTEGPIVGLASGSPPPPSLAAEVRLLDEARSLAHSSPAVALAVLDEHARTFPAGALRDEAAVVRLEALLAAGRRAEADRHAAPFLRNRAGTPIARRMSALLVP